MPFARFVMVPVYEWVSYDSIWADVDSIWADSESDFHTSRAQDTHPFALITHHHPPTSSSERLSLINSIYFGEEKASATMIEGKQQMISHIQDLEN